MGPTDRRGSVHAAREDDSSVGRVVELQGCGRTPGTVREARERSSQAAAKTTGEDSDMTRAIRSFLAAHGSWTGTAVEMT